MAKPVSISLKKFTASVQAAVKAAVAKHPKFQVPAPNAVSFGYLIRGIPVAEEIVAKVTMAEMQAFASEVAGQIGQAHPEALAAGRGTPVGAVLSVGHHVICGIPPIEDVVQFEP
jgi:hypothetical protein